MVKRLSEGAKAEIAERKLREDVKALCGELDSYDNGRMRPGFMGVH